MGDLIETRRRNDVTSVVESESEDRRQLYNCTVVRSNNLTLDTVLGSNDAQKGILIPDVF